MPKRSHEKDEFEYLRKKVKKLERKFVKSRRRTRIIESSSSSSSSRDSSPAPHNHQGGPLQIELDESTSPRSEQSRPTALDSDVDEPVATLPVSVEGPSTSAIVTETATNNSSEVADAPSISLPDDVLCDILGEDPSTKEEYGQDVNKDLANRLHHLITTGLDSKQRKEIISKYLTPANCTLIAAPILNQEIKAALIESLQKRDKYIEVKQKQLGSAIACLASAMSEHMESKNIDQPLLKKLMDTMRLLCDIQHTDSKTRRSLALNNLKKDMKEHLLNTKTDKFLFGENLSETLKSAKAVNKSSTELRVKVQPRTTKKSVPQTKKPLENNLNWKSPAPARRAAGPQWSQKPALHRSQPGNSSKQSSPPPRTTRRR